MASDSTYADLAGIAYYESLLSVESTLWPPASANLDATIKSSQGRVSRPTEKYAILRVTRLATLAVIRAGPWTTAERALLIQIERGPTMPQRSALLDQLDAKIRQMCGLISQADAESVARESS